MNSSLEFNILPSSGGVQSNRRRHPQEESNDETTATTTTTTQCGGQLNKFEHLDGLLPPPAAPLAPPLPPRGGGKRGMRASFSILQHSSSSTTKSMTRSGGQHKSNKRRSSYKKLQDDEAFHTSKSEELLDVGECSSGDFLEALSSIQAWSRQQEHAKARQAVQVAILDQKQVCSNMDKLIGRATEFIAARMESNNRIGAVLSMKQVLKYEALQKKATLAVAKLQEYARQLDGDDEDDDQLGSDDYQAKIDNIVNGSVEESPTNLLAEKTTSSEVLLTLAKQRLQRLDQVERNPRAA